MRLAQGGLSNKEISERVKEQTQKEYLDRVRAAIQAASEEGAPDTLIQVICKFCYLDKLVLLFNTYICIYHVSTQSQNLGDTVVHLLTFLIRGYLNSFPNFPQK